MNAIDLFKTFGLRVMTWTAMVHTDGSIDVNQNGRKAGLKGSASVVVYFNCNCVSASY